MSEGEFNETVRSNFQSLVRTAEAILGCSEAAEDAVQQSLMRIWRNIATFDPKKGTLEALLHVSAKRQAMDHLTSRKRRLAAMERFWGETVVEERPKKADPRLPRLVAALEKLPEKKRVLVQKYYFEGNAVSVIAAEMGLSQSATKSRLQTIKGTLERLIKKEREV